MPDLLASDFASFCVRGDECSSVVWISIKPKLFKLFCPTDLDLGEHVGARERLRRAPEGLLFWERWRDEGRCNG